MRIKGRICGPCFCGYYYSMRKILIFLLFTLTVLLVSCTRQKTSVQNPMHSSSYEQILEKDGFSLSVPEGSNDVHYFRIFSDKDSVLCQVSFDLDGKVYTYRGKRTDSPVDISGMYYTWNEQEKVGDATVLLSSEGPGIALWYEKGVSFALICLDEASVAGLMDVKARL